MWEIFEKLCKERGVTPYRVGEETGIKTSALSAEVYTHLGWQDIDSEQINNIFRES